MTSEEMSRRRKAAMQQKKDAFSQNSSLEKQRSDTAHAPKKRSTHFQSRASSVKRNRSVPFDHEKRRRNLPAKSTERYRTRMQERLFKDYIFQYDYVLLFLTLFVVGFGALMIYSSSSYTAYMHSGDSLSMVKKQVKGVAVGLVFMFILSKIEYQNLKRPLLSLKKRKLIVLDLAYIGALFLQMAVYIPGIGVAHNGEKRWVKIGIEFQPSEISKIAMILMAAYLIERSGRYMNRDKNIYRTFFYAVPLIGLVALHNMSTAIVMFVIVMGMIFVSTPKWKPIGKIILTCACLGVCLLLLNMLHGNGFRLNRILTFFDLEGNQKGYQTLQGLYAVGSGGIFGRGLGNGIQKLGSMPEPFNDMIFAVICEELGLIGALLLVVVFAIMSYRILCIAMHAPDLFGRMIAMGVMLQLSVQVVFNMFVVLHIIPSTGIPLPFISYGGTSCMIMMAEMGIVLNISSQVRIKIS